MTLVPSKRFRGISPQTCVHEMYCGQQPPCCYFSAYVMARNAAECLPTAVSSHHRTVSFAERLCVCSSLRLNLPSLILSRYSLILQQGRKGGMYKYLLLQVQEDYSIKISILGACKYGIVRTMTARSNRSQRPSSLPPSISKYFVVASTRASFCHIRPRHDEVFLYASSYCLVIGVSTLGVPIAIVYITDRKHQAVRQFESAELLQQSCWKSKELSIAW